MSDLWWSWDEHQPGQPQNYALSVKYCLNLFCKLAQTLKKNEHKLWNNET